MTTISKAIQLIQSQQDNEITNSAVGFDMNFGIKTSINISMDNSDSFYGDLLTFSAEEMENAKNPDITENFGLPFLEKINDHVPIIIDMKFSIIDQEATSFYDDRFIISVVKILQECICQFTSISLDNGHNPPTLRCFVLETPIWSDDSKQYMNVRFQFPYTKVSKNIVNMHVIRELISDLSSTDYFKLFHQTPIDVNWGNIIKPIGKSISFYGSKELEREQPLILKYIIGFIENFNPNIELENGIEEEPYYISYDDQCIDPKECSLITQGIITESHVWMNKIQLIPLILSIHYHRSFTQILPDTIKIEDFQQVKFIGKDSGFSRENDCIAEFEQIVNLINPEKFSLKYKYTWIGIGRAIHNIYEGGQAGFQKFYELTNADLKNKCEETWETFSSEVYDIRVIKEYASKDSPILYNEWLSQTTKPILLASVSGKNMIMATLVQKYLCLEYLYCSESEDWFRRKKSRLIRDKKGLELRNTISKKIRPLYVELREYYEAEKSTKTTPDEKKYFTMKIQEVDKLMDKLDVSTFLDSIISALKSKMYDDNFAELKDENLQIMSCDNTVIECFEGNCVRRPLKIQDYITKSTNISFPFSYTINTPQVKFLLKYYGQVHTDPELLNYFLTDMGSYVEGGNHEKLFRNWIGESNASKSQVIKLLQLSLGDYCVDLPEDEIIIIKNKGGGGPNHAVELAKGAHLGIVAETNKSQPLDVAKIKKRTGNDRYYNRTLNKEGRSRNLSYKIIHMSNVMADRPNADEAYLMREMIIPFLSKWCIDAPYEEAEQYRQRKFKMDLEFSNRLKSLAQAQLFLMCHYYPIYKRDGIRNPPKVVIDTTLRFQQSKDPYYNFIQARLQKITLDKEGTILDESVSVTLFDTFQQYRMWFTTFAPGIFFETTQEEFKTEMTSSSRLGALNYRSEWVGRQLITRG